MGLPLVSKDPKFFGPPVVNIGGNDGSFSTFGLQRTIGPRERSNGIYQFVDNLSWQNGRHFLKFGADIARRLVTFNQARDPRGAFSFDGTYTAPLLADFMLGYVRTASLNPAVTVTDLTNFWQALLLQRRLQTLPASDSQLRPPLRLLRQNGPEATTSSSISNRTACRLLALPRPERFASTAAASCSRTRITSSPRFGFAYQPGFAKDMVSAAVTACTIRRRSPTPSLPWPKARRPPPAPASSATSPAPRTSSSPTPSLGPSPQERYNFAVSNDQNMRDSYIQQWNVNVQKKIMGRLRPRRRLCRQQRHPPRRHPWRPEPSRRKSSTPAFPAPRRSTPAVPNQLFQRAVTGDKAIGNSIYNAFQLKVERRMATGITVLSAFTASRAYTGPTDIGGQVGGGNYIGSVQDLYNLRGERAVAGFDQTYPLGQHGSLRTALYEGRSDGPGRVLRQGLAGIDDPDSAYRLRRTDRLWSSIPPAPASAPVRTSWPVRTATCPARTAPGSVGLTPMHSPSIPTRPPSRTSFYGRFGTAPRTNAVRLPGMVNTDFSANKRFAVGERRYFEFRTEVFNLFNHYNPDVASVDLNIRSQTFGTIGGGVRGTTTRVIQLGAKFVF